MEWEALFERERGRVEDTAVNACLRPLVSLDGAAIATTEGIGSTRETLDPVQFRVAAYNGSQCGYCTSGMIMAAKALLARTPNPTLEQVKQGLAGSLCRCGTHTRILRAVMRAARV